MDLRLKFLDEIAMELGERILTKGYSYIPKGTRIKPKEVLSEDYLVNYNDWERSTAAIRAHNEYYCPIDA